MRMLVRNRAVSLSDLAKHLSDADVAVLATYNAEVQRGLVHTAEWQERMADLQRRFDRR